MKDLIQFNGAPVIPYDDSSRFSKISWSTVSNAALRSRSPRMGNIIYIYIYDYMQMHTGRFRPNTATHTLVYAWTERSTVQALRVANTAGITTRDNEHR